MIVDHRQAVGEEGGRGLPVSELHPERSAIPGRTMFEHNVIAFDDTDVPQAWPESVSGIQETECLPAAISASSEDPAVEFG